MGVALNLTGNGSFYITDAGIMPGDPTRHSTFSASISADFEDDRYAGMQDPKIYNDVFEYASPLGMAYGLFGAIKPKLSATITNECSGKWNVCVHDSGNSKSGIRYVELLNYQKNTYVNSLHAAYNIAFDPLIDSMAKGEIVLPGTDTVYCFSLAPINSSDTSYATLEVYDNSGASLLIDLSKKVSLTSTVSGLITQLSANIFSYSLVPVATSHCGTISLSVPATTGARDFMIAGISIQGDSNHFKLQAPIATPLTIKPGSSLPISVCFTPGDTALTQATLLLASDCGSVLKYTLQGRGQSGLIRANDYTFAETAQGDKTCVSGVIKNTGSLPFKLLGSQLSDSANFSIDPGFLATLPQTIAPGDSVNPIVCFNPQDKDSHTGTLTWVTDIATSLDARMKRISLLNGKGYNAGVEWDPLQLQILVDTGKSQTESTGRIYLANHGTTKKIDVQKFSISGPDSAEFAVSKNEFGFDPPFSVNIADSLWLDVKFTPDFSKGSTVRSAYLNVIYNVDGSGANQFSAVPLFGSFTSTTTGSVEQHTQNTLCRAYISSRRLLLFLPTDCSGRFECSVYDLLGRNIFSSNDIAYGRPLIYELGNIPDGMYIVRITNGVSEWVTRAMQSR
jgi:hypothetical protein